MSRKIARAVKAGPGFLDYCPRHPGTAPAELQVDMPGNPLIHARCRTSIQVQSAGERVTFQIRWDARKVLHRTGESTLTYLVPRSHGQILLIKQTGTLPP